MAPLPQPCAGCAVGITDGNLIVAGGSYWSGGRKIWSKRVDRLDLATNRWRPAAALPHPNADAGCVQLGEALLILGGTGGGSPEAAVWRLAHDAWSHRPELSLPAARRAPSAVVIENTIYIVGGFAGIGLESATATVWAHRGQWEACAPLPGPPRFNPAIVGITGEILLAGGAALLRGRVENLDDVWSYCPVRDKWRELARLGVPTRAAAGITDGERFVIIGGYTTDYARQVWQVDPRTGEVAAAGTLPHGLADTRVRKLERRIIAVSGECGPRIRAVFPVEATALD